jgi:hypothetical protein
VNSSRIQKAGNRQTTMEDQIRYDILTQDALRGVVRHVLADAARHGLPGEHHFFISFNTNAEGVRMSPRLREQYPKDITIVLQHQFRDLRVEDDHFEVSLSFGGVPERLSVPFAAIKSFFDPSVQFGLQFEIVSEGEEEAPTEAGGAPAKAPPPLAAPATEGAGASKAESKGGDEGPDKPSGGAEVVRLDRFRKK